jgi:transketolase
MCQLWIAVNSFSSADGLSKGAYVLADLGSGSRDHPDASGSEVSLIIEAGQKLGSMLAAMSACFHSHPGIYSEAQPEDYQKKVLPDSDC